MIQRTTMMMATLLMMMCSGVDGWSQTSYAWEGTWKVKASVQYASDEVGDEIGDPVSFSDELTIRVEADSVLVCLKNPPTTGMTPFVSCLKYPSNNLGCDTCNLRWNVPTGRKDGRSFSCSNSRIYKALSADDRGCLSLYPSVTSYRQVDISEGDIDQEDLEGITQNITLVVDGKGVLEGSISVRWICGGSESVIYEFVSVNSQTNLQGQDAWVKLPGGSGKEHGRSITQTTDGGLLVTGTTGSNDYDFEGVSKGKEDIFVIKLDKNGEILWRKSFGGGGNEWSLCVSTMSDGGSIATGGFGSDDLYFRGMKKGETDIFVMRYDKEGNVLWNRSFGGTQIDYGCSLASANGNEFLLAGVTSSNDGDFEGMNNGQRDIFVIKVDKEGNMQWSRAIGGTRDDEPSTITITPDRGFLLAGKTNSNDGDFTGMKISGSDVFIMKLDIDGGILWKRTYGGSGTDYPLSLTTTSDGCFLITGSTRSNDGDFSGLRKGSGDKGEGDVFVIKLDKNGDVLWKKTFGGGRDDVGSSINTTANGDIVITGGTESNDGDFKSMNHSGDKRHHTYIHLYDIFVIKLNTNGEILWKRTFGGSSSDFGTSITTTSDGGFVLTGGTESNDGDFKGMNKGEQDIFVMKLDSNGNLKPSGKKKSKKK